jgi:predicted nucleic acid-binding protein
MRYIDVNVFVYWLGDDPIYGAPATEIIARIEKGERAATSSLSLWLTNVVLSSLAERYSEREFVDKIKALTFLRVEPLLSEDYIRATEYVEKNSLDLEDALHLATAIRLGADEIYSNDADFDKTPLKRIGFDDN